MLKEKLVKEIVELSAYALIGYGISRFMRISIARGHSMMPTIKNNGLMLVDCRAYKRRKPKRGDIIAFRSRIKGQPRFFVKRVIGLPGEVITIDDKDLFIDGQLLEEHYVNEPMAAAKSTYKVGENQLFVMGDNRNHSYDSRKMGSIFINKDIMGVVLKR